VCGLAGKWGSAIEEDFAIFEFPFTAELETLVVKDNNGCIMLDLLLPIWQL